MARTNKSLIVVYSVLVFFLFIPKIVQTIDRPADPCVFDRTASPVIVACGATSTCSTPSASQIQCDGIVFTKTTKDCQKQIECDGYTGTNSGRCLEGFCYLDEAGFEKFQTQPTLPIPLVEVKSDLEIFPPQTNIKIPSLSDGFSDVSKNLVEEEGDTYLLLPWIGEYLGAIFNFALGVVSIVAVVMVIIHGAKVVVSAGGSAKAEAYKRITQAVIGLVIMWGSYAILYTINPELVRFKNLSVLYIKGKTLDTLPDAHDEDADAEMITEAGQTAEPGAAGAVTGATIPTTPIVGSEGAPDCSAFVTPACPAEDLYNPKAKHCNAQRDKCRRACLAQLPEEKKTKVFIEGKYFSSKFTGALDCNVKPKERKLSAIKAIVIHEGGNAIGTWWNKHLQASYTPGSRNKYLGTHFTISAGGSVIQITDLKYTVIHSSRADSIGIDISASKFSEKGKRCASVGYSTEYVKANCGYEDVVYNKLNTLISELQEAVKKAGGGSLEIFGHCELPGSTHTDPRNFNLDKVTGQKTLNHAGGKCSYVFGQEDKWP